MAARQRGSGVAPDKYRDPDLLIENEYAGVRVVRDSTANGSRLRVTSLRSDRETFLDPVALDLLCHARQEFWVLLADAARDPEAWRTLRLEFRNHFQT